MMIGFNILWIGNSIQRFFEKLIYNIVYGMYQLAYFVEQIFLILVGVQPLKGNTGLAY